MVSEHHGDFTTKILGEILNRTARTDLLSTSLVSRFWRCLTLKQITAINTREQFKEAARQGNLLSIVYAECVNLDWGLEGARHGGHRELVELMIEKGAASCSCGKSIAEHL